MSCIYCNGDPTVANSCYCRTLPDVLTKGIINKDGSINGPVVLGSHQQIYNMSFWFPFFSPQQNKLFNKVVKNATYGVFA